MSKTKSIKWTAKDRADADMLASNIASGNTTGGRTSDRNKLVNRFGYPLAHRIADTLFSLERPILMDVALSMFLLFLANWDPDDKGFLDEVESYMLQKTESWFQDPEDVIWTMPKPVGDRMWSIAAIDSAVLMSRVPGRNGEKANKSMEVMLRRFVEATATSKGFPHLYEDLYQQSWLIILTKLIPRYDPRLNGFAPYANTALVRALDKFIAKQTPAAIPKSTLESKHLTYDWGISDSDSPEAALLIERAMSTDTHDIENEALHEVELNGRSFDDICNEIAEAMSDPSNPHMERWLYAKGFTSPDHKPMTIKEVMAKFGIAERTAQKSIQIINDSLDDNPNYNYVRHCIYKPLMDD